MESNLSLSFYYTQFNSLLKKHQEESKEVFDKMFQDILAKYQHESQTLGDCLSALFLNYLLRWRSSAIKAADSLQLIKS